MVRRKVTSRVTNTGCPIKPSYPISVEPLVGTGSRHVYDRNCGTSQQLSGGDGPQHNFVELICKDPVRGRTELLADARNVREDNLGDSDYAIDLTQFDVPCFSRLIRVRS